MIHKSPTDINENKDTAIKYFELCLKTVSFKWVQLYTAHILCSPTWRLLKCRLSVWIKLCKSLIGTDDVCLFFFIEHGGMISFFFYEALHSVIHVYCTNQSYISQLDGRCSENVLSKNGMGPFREQKESFFSPVKFSSKVLQSREDLRIVVSTFLTWETTVLFEWIVLCD